MKEKSKKLRKAIRTEDLEKKNLFNQIQEHYIDGKTLPPKIQVIASRWQAAFMLLIHYKSKARVVKILSKMKDIDGNKTSQPQIYRDLRSAELLFGNVNKWQKDTIRYMINDSCLKEITQLEEMMNQAKKKSDWDNYERFSRLKDKAETRLIKSNALDKEDPDIPDFTKLQPNQYLIGLDEQTNDLLKSILDDSGSVDVSKFLSDNSEDIEHE